MPEQTIGFPSTLDVGQATDVGRVREANEDSLLATPAGRERRGQVLLAVADGMGGHKAGEVASAIAIECLSRALGETEPDASAGSLLARAVETANRSIWEAANDDVEKEGMGTTLVCALLNAEGEVTIANVGDSRAYSYVNGQVSLVTVDHTWVNQQVLTGQMSERDARHSPYRNLLTRSLGSTPSIQVDLFTGLRLSAGDALVLVSDGVSGYLEEHDVASIVRDSATAQAAAEHLVAEAVRRGGADNATAVVVRRQVADMPTQPNITLLGR
jgi:serine/threonine protein phosphatase PrpC